jgi:hypothetical protein
MFILEEEDVRMLFQATFQINSRAVCAALTIAMLLLLAVPSSLRAQQSDEFDQYKVRLEGYMFYSNPTGNFQASSDVYPVDLQKNLGFNSYATFSGKVDWKFTHKNHFYLWISPFYTSATHTLSTSFTFQGKPFDVGLVANSSLHSFLVAPGYQYDIIRRKRGHLGIGVQMDLFNTTAKISASGTVNGEAITQSASGSLLAPIPVAGPQFRLYLTDSPRIYIDGDLYGMYFFGYGNFVSTTDALGVMLTRHVSLSLGYQLGSRLIVNNDTSTNRLGVHLTQQGGIAGLQYTF